MRVYVITETAVKTYNSWNKLQKELSIEKTEATPIGKDFVINMTDQSFDIAKDIKLLETVASKKVFSKDKFDITNWLQVITIIVVYFMTRG